MSEQQNPVGAGDPSWWMFSRLEALYRRSARSE